MPPHPNVSNGEITTLFGQGAAPSLEILFCVPAPGLAGAAGPAAACNCLAAADA